MSLALRVRGRVFLLVEPSGFALILLHIYVHLNIEGLSIILERHLFVRLEDFKVGSLCRVLLVASCPVACHLVSRVWSGFHLGCFVGIVGCRRGCNDGSRLCGVLASTLDGIAMFGSRRRLIQLERLGRISLGLPASAFGRLLWRQRTRLASMRFGLASLRTQDISILAHVGRSAYVLAGLTRRASS